MVASESPAGARRRLRLALRRLRDRRNLTQHQVAEALDWSISKVNRIENGEVTISVTDLQAALNLYAVDDAGERAALVGAARAARKRDLTYPPRFYESATSAMMKHAQVERIATAIRSFYPTLIDGLLQTPEYASAILGYVAEELPDAVRQDRLELRIRRQADVLERHDPPTLLVLMDESALYRAVGGPEVLEQQLERILQLARRSHVTVRVLKMTEGAMLALLEAFIIIDLEGEENAFLYRERVLDDELVEEMEVVQRYRRRFEEGWELALSETASVELIEARKAQLLLLENAAGD
jgi:transcriptional regulator with XRE-family HTH domain